MRIGIDLVRIERFAHWATNRATLEKVFSPAEQDLILECNGKRRIELIAGRFAAKEAVIKAIGSGFHGEIRLTEIETLKRETGAPYLTFRGTLEGYVNDLGLGHEVSISHDGGMAIAVVVFY
ncbi:MAG: holo-ACP synthase [Eubacteriales bacterium]|nr:holo-ACP synthase [Eubacteriales bacterium]